AAQAAARGAVGGQYPAIRIDQAECVAAAVEQGAQALPVLLQRRGITTIARGLLLLARQPRCLLDTLTLAAALQQQPEQQQRGCSAGKAEQQLQRTLGQRGGAHAVVGLQCGNPPLVLGGFEAG